MNGLYDYVKIFVIVCQRSTLRFMIRKALMAVAFRKPHISVSVKELMKLAIDFPRPA